MVVVLLLLLLFFGLIILNFFAVGLVAHIVQSRPLNVLDQVLECLGELVFLSYAVLQKLEMSKQLFRIVLIEKGFLEAGGSPFLLLELLENLLGAESFWVDVTGSVGDSGGSTEIGQDEVPILL